MSCSYWVNIDEIVLLNPRNLNRINGFVIPLAIHLLAEWRGARVFASGAGIGIIGWARGWWSIKFQ